MLNQLFRFFNVTFFKCSICKIVVVVAENICSDKLNLVLLRLGKFIVHDLLVLGAVDVTKILGTLLVSWLNLGNADDCSQ